MRRNNKKNKINNNIFKKNRIKIYNNKLSQIKIKYNNKR